eukprot:TRINITY_DN40547_c0_g1_i1.p1 TRINITY_DN40547_c0_g1~~TRINITY_DN40547_c0_g1_i1.p1  ORF type:complete len:358 (-),score=50.46 TRINITY_DN40547_c0_g1_i1:150-1223(-)
MNVANAGNNGLLHVTFNQDYSCLALVTTQGYKIYNCDPWTKAFEKAETGVGIIEMLFSSSLVALTGSGDNPSFSPRRLKVVNTKTGMSICELNFMTAVLGVRMNRRRLAVILDTKIHLYDLEHMKLLHTIMTAPNHKGIAALSPNEETSYLAYPGSNAVGEVIIFDALGMHAVSVLPAHQSPLSTMTFNQRGTMLATTSEKGTVIRIYSVPSGRKLYTFRRGAYPASIYSLSFNPASTLLCVSSETGTVHVFKLEQGAEDTNVQSVTNVVASYLPAVMNDIVEPARSFAAVKLRSQGVPNICTITADDSRVVVVSAEGNCYQYSLDRVNGGECRLERESTLLRDTAAEQASARLIGE